MKIIISCISYSLFKVSGSFAINNENKGRTAYGNKGFLLYLHRLTQLCIHLAIMSSRYRLFCVKNIINRHKTKTKHHLRFSALR